MIHGLQNFQNIFYKFSIRKTRCHTKCCIIFISNIIKLEHGLGKKLIANDAITHQKKSFSLIKFPLIEQLSVKLIFRERKYFFLSYEEVDE